MSISELGNHRHFVRNNDNGRRFRDMFDNLIDLFDEISVDIRERLIEHNYRRGAYDCPPQQGALELSARQGANVLEGKVTLLTNEIVPYAFKKRFSLVKLRTF